MGTNGSLRRASPPGQDHGLRGRHPAKWREARAPVPLQLRREREVLVQERPPIHAPGAGAQACKAALVRLQPVARHVPEQDHGDHPRRLGALLEAAPEMGEAYLQS